MRITILKLQNNLRNKIPMYITVRSYSGIECLMLINDDFIIIRWINTDRRPYTAVAIENWAYIVRFRQKST